jgi:hypothetical protein
MKVQITSYRRAVHPARPLRQLMSWIPRPRARRTAVRCATCGQSAVRPGPKTCKRCGQSLRSAPRVAVATYHSRPR